MNNEQRNWNSDNDITLPYTCVVKSGEYNDWSYCNAKMKSNTCVIKIFWFLFFTSTFLINYILLIYLINF